MDRCPQPAAEADAERVLDARGLYCPVPILRTRERLKRMPPGSLLVVLADDRVVLKDMPAFCRSFGHEYLGAVEQGAELHLTVRKAGARDGA